MSNLFPPIRLTAGAAQCGGVLHRAGVRLAGRFRSALRRRSGARRPVVGFAGAALRILSLGFVVGFVALLLMPAAEGPVLAQGPAASACKKQHWPNVERRCLWSDAAREAKAKAKRPPEAAAVAAPAESAVETTAVAGALVAEPSREPAAATADSPVSRPPVARAGAHEHADAEPALRRAMRSEDSPRRARASRGGIPVAVVGEGGVHRTIIIRPTSPQDVYYYSQRSLERDAKKWEPALRDHPAPSDSNRSRS